MDPKGSERYPFRAFRRDGEQLFGSFFDVHEFEGDPRFIVKELREPSLPGQEGGAVEKVKADVALLEKYFKRYLPVMQLVVARTEEGGMPTLFVVQERIDKQSFNFETALSPDELRSLDDFVCRMIEMYRDTYDGRRDEGKVPEVQPGGSALLLGRAAARPEEDRRFYLVDVYPAPSLESMVFKTLMDHWIAFIEDRIEGGWQIVPLKSRKVLEEALLDIAKRQIP